MFGTLQVADAQSQCDELSQELRAARTALADSNAHSRQLQEDRLRLLHELESRARRLSLTPSSPGSPTSSIGGGGSGSNGGISPRYSEREGEAAAALRAAKASAVTVAHLSHFFVCSGSFQSSCCAERAHVLQSALRKPGTSQAC